MGTPPPIELANLGMADSLILMVMALVVFGPRRLPQIGRQIGKLMYEFRKASNDFKFQMEEELRLSEEADRRKKEEEERLRAAALAPAVQPALAATAPEPTIAGQTIDAHPIEAQADIGAAETSVASPYPGEGTYPEQYPAETPAEAGETGTVPTGTTQAPTIQPPSTGEQIPASRPIAPNRHYTGVYIDSNGAAPESNGAPAFGSDAGAEAAVTPATTPESSTSPTEPVSQHG